MEGNLVLFKAAIALASGALVLGTAACSKSVEGQPKAQHTGPQVFDADKMAKDIGSSTYVSSLGLGQVICPQQEPVVRGRTFDCHAGNAVIHIRVTSDSGAYTYQVDGR